MRAILIGLAVVATASPAGAEAWHPYSRTPRTVFMADVDSIVQVSDVTTMKTAMVPLEGAAGDYSHSVETYEFQCAAKRWRTAGLVEYGATGAEDGAYPEADAGWEPIRPNTVPEQLLGIACEGARAAPPIWPTVQAYVDAGRT